jgi:ATP-dependent DNA helicase RecG
LNLTDLPNLSIKRLNALQYAGIERTIDLLYFFPRRYIDQTTTLPMRSLKGRGEKVNVVGNIKHINQVGYRSRKRLEITIRDETGSVKGVWFNGLSYIKKHYKKGDRVLFFGKVKKYRGKFSIVHPKVEKIGNAGDMQNIARIVSVYPGNKYFSKTYITNKLLNQWIEVALKHARLSEFLPASIREKYSFPERVEALRMIHFPESKKEHQQALKRFKYAELFLLQLSMARLKHTTRKMNDGIVFDTFDNLTSDFFNHHLPFELTGAQRGALNDIKKDVRSGRQMNRLLQGDVGSGKTIVAIGAILMALDNQCQAAFMAPTEILAEQHYRTLQEYLEPLGINIRLLVGGQKSALRNDILSSLQGGRCQIVVGTHAIIQDNISFNNLGLVVIDEQHRFGVQQRAEILQKGENPHILVMSATPIPRSLAMTYYSDLDISLMDELPGGRKPVKTAIRSAGETAAIYRFIEDVLEEKGQAYVVYPLVEESEKIDLRDATEGFEELTSRFPNYSVGLLHGQMPSDEKDAAMQKFIRNEVQILVSTTVIEVGVDVPNATIMMIRHADCFGLSQLHQLRGRIGRGPKQSYCILIYDRKVGKEAKFRLQKMAETNDGFAIAEADLQLRGPGDFLGTKQSGLPEFKIADIIEDQALVVQAKEDAKLLIMEDPRLQKSEHRSLRKVFIPYFKRKKQYYGLA